MYRLRVCLGLLFGATSSPMAGSHEIDNYFGERTLSTGFVVPATHTISGPLLADIDGNGLRDLCTTVYSGTNQDSAELHFFDLENRQTIATLPISRHPTDLYPADIDGDGSEEIILINDASYAGRALGLELFRWVQGEIVHTTHEEFTGIGIRTGDVNGDGKDEIILCDLPRGHTNLGGTGPIRIQVLSWNGTDFESIARVNFPTAYFQIYVGDLDNSGRDEIAILRSGSRETQVGFQPPQLGIYTYTGEFELTLRDEMEFPIPYFDNLPRIWGIPLPDDTIRLLVPIPGRSDEEDVCLGFRFKDEEIAKERDVYTVYFWGYQSPRSPILYRPSFNRMDVNSDNKLEVLRTYDVGLNRYLQFVEEPVPDIRTVALPIEQQVQNWKRELLEITADSIMMHCHIEGHLYGLPGLPWPKSMQELLHESLEEYDKKINSVYWQTRIAEGRVYGCGECLVSLLRMASFQLNPDFLPIFIKYLDLSSWPAEGLAALGPRAFEPVMEIIEQNEPSRHYRAAETLGYLFRSSSILYENIETRERAVLGLLKLVRSGCPATRRAAIESFRYIDDDRAVALLDSIAQADIYDGIRKKAHEVADRMQMWREDGPP